MTGLGIRHLDGSDLEIYTDIRLEALENSGENFSSTYAYEADEIASLFANRIKEGAIYGCFVDDRLVATASLGYNHVIKEAHKAYLSGMYVTHRMRSKGIGSRLLRYLLRDAKKSFEQVTLKTISSNINSIEFYRKHDFREYGLEPRALKYAGQYSDDVLMVKFLFDLEY